MKRNLRGIALILAVCLLLNCVACGGTSAAAATMHLRKTEGTVDVSDGEGKGVETRENLGLYSGYGVNTQAKSYAWIDLDSVKLTKLDQDSEIEITKDGKNLEIEVLSGSLFFNVTEPLKDDETMEIRSSTMAVGIRGTCGWVSLSKDEKTLSVCLLEGKVECTNGEKMTVVQAGEMGVIPTSGKITVTSFDTSSSSLPPFVQEEIEPENGSISPVTEWPIVTERVLDDGTVFTTERYEDGSQIERMTAPSLSWVQERNTNGQVIWFESTTPNADRYYYTYNYQENSPVVVVSALWTQNGETKYQLENFSYTMLDSSNHITASGLGTRSNDIREISIYENRATFEDARAVDFELDMNGNIVGTYER